MSAQDNANKIHLYIPIVYVCIYLYLFLIPSWFVLAFLSHIPSVPRFRKPDNYLMSRVPKRLCGKLRRSATAPTDVAHMKNETHQESIFHDASEYFKRGLTIKRLRSADVFLRSCTIFFFQVFISINSM